MWEVYMKLAQQQSFGSNLSDGTARLGTNTIKHASEMELYIILANSDNFAGI